MARAGMPLALATRGGQPARVSGRTDRPLTGACLPPGRGNVAPVGFLVAGERRWRALARSNGKVVSL